MSTSTSTSTSTTTTTTTDDYGINQTHLNGYSAAILVLFVLTSFFVIYPVRIPLLAPLQRWLLSFLRTTRVLDPETAERLRGRKLYFLLGLETAPVIAVLALLASGTMDGSTIVLGVKGDENVKPYDVLVLFISLAYIAIALDGTGALEAVAFWVSRRGGSSGPRLFAYLYAFFLFTGCIVGNDPLILSGTPFLAYLTKSTDLEPTAWIFSEFMAANTASAVLVSSNPTNILITGSFSLNFLTGFTKWTILPSVIPGILNYFVLYFMFRHKIPKTLTPLKDDPWSKLRDAKGAFFLSSLMLVTISVLVGTSFVPGNKVQVWMVTMPAGLLALSFEVVRDWFAPQAARKTVREEKMDGAAEKKTSVDSKGSTVADEAISTERADGKIEADGPVQLDGDDNGNGNGNDSQTQISDENEKPLHPSPTSAPTRNHYTLESSFRFLSTHQPRASRTIRHLPLPLLPFAICQFILVRSLSQRGWITVFAHGFSHATPTPAASVFFFGFISAAFLCPFAGTNIGATILLVEIMRDPVFMDHADQRVLNGAIYATAMGSNLGAFSYVFAASLAGLLWKGLLADKGIDVSRVKFCVVNLAPLLIQCVVAFGIVLGEVYWFG